MGSLLYTDGKIDYQKLGGFLGCRSRSFWSFGPDRQPVGYQGSIPEYTAVREAVPLQMTQTEDLEVGDDDTSPDVTYAPEGDSICTQTAASEQVLGLKALNLANPFRQDRPASVVPDVPATQGITTAANTSTPMTTVQDLQKN